MFLENAFENIGWYFVFALAGMVSTFCVHHKLQQGAVRASAGMSLVVGLVFMRFPNLFEPQLQVTLPLVFIGASFMGMSNTQHFKQYWQFVVSAVLFSLLFLASDVIFVGYGGKLGLMANISVIVSIGILSVLKRNFKKSN